MLTFPTNQSRELCYPDLWGEGEAGSLWTSEQASAHEDSLSVSCLGPNKKQRQPNIIINNKTNSKQQQQQQQQQERVLEVRDVHCGPRGAKRQDPDDQLRGLQVWKNCENSFKSLFYKPSRTNTGEDVSSVSTSRIPCTSFLSRFFRSPETSILEVTFHLVQREWIEGRNCFCHW